MLTSEVRKHSNELWRKGRVWLKVTGDVTVLKIIKRMRQAHYDIDQTRWHAQQIRPRSPFSTAWNENTFVLLCSSMCKSKCQIHHITGQREITANEILHTHTVSGPWWVLVSPAGDTWRGGTDSSLTDMQERELKRMSTQTLYSHLCSDYNFHSRSEGTTVWYELAKHVSNTAFDIIFIII